MLSEIGMPATKSIHLEESVCEDTGESRGHAADQVEDCITLLEIVSGVPAAQEIRTAGEEASFENSEDETKWNER